MRCMFVSHNNVSNVYKVTIKYKVVEVEIKHNVVDVFG